MAVSMYETMSPLLEVQAKLSNEENYCHSLNTNLRCTYSDILKIPRLLIVS